MIIFYKVLATLFNGVIMNKYIYLSYTNIIYYLDKIQVKLQSVGNCFRRKRKK